MRRALTTVAGALLASALCFLGVSLAFGISSGGQGGVDWPAFWKAYWKSHDEITWVAMGDSITAGDMRYTNGGKYYFEWMRTRLNGELGKQVTVIDTAVGGTHLYQFADEQLRQAEQYAPELVTVYFGMNDGIVDQGQVRAGFEQLVAQLVPTPENVAAGVPEDRVVVLAACQPAPAELGDVRQVHAYGQELSDYWCARGYKVQFIDLHRYFQEELPYGARGYLGSFDDYVTPGAPAHLNARGQYAAAQYLMEQMGLYSAESAACTLAHEQISTDPGRPASLQAWAEVSTEPADPVLESIGASLTSGEPGTLLILGGGNTAGEGLLPEECRTYADLLTSTLRCELGLKERQVAVFAGERYDAAWYYARLERLLERFGPRWVVYMPEVDSLYSDGYKSGSGAVEEYGKAVAGVAELCRSAGAELLLLTPFPMAGQEGETRLEPYLDCLKRVAKEQDVPLFDLHATLRAEMELDTVGGWFGSRITRRPTGRTQAEALTLLARGLGL